MSSTGAPLSVARFGGSMDRWRGIPFFLVVLSLSSCASSSDAGLDAAIDSAIGVDGAEGVDARVAVDAGSDAWLVRSDAGCATQPTFADVSATVFSGCGGFPICHGTTATHAGDLGLQDPDTYQQLVGVPSMVSASVLRVEAGNASTSLLYRKLIDDLPADGSLGGPMPRGEGIPWHELPPAELELVRCWIAGGAPR
jgi:hypothetical protein